MKFRPFAEARGYVHKLGLKSREEWKQYCRSGNKPADIPNYPNDVPSYHEYWKGWGDWLGSGTVAPFNRVYRPFAEARAFVHSLGLKSSEEWKQYCRSGNKPADIPSQPRDTYKTEFKGMGDWLGTRRIANQNRIYRPFAQARAFVRKLGLKESEDWNNYCNSGKKPDDIPKYPTNILAYKKHWKGWGDWLGTGVTSTHDRVHRPFAQARAFVRSLGLKSGKEWEEYCKSGKKPDDIPNYPVDVLAYKKHWKGWGDWLGTGVTSTHDRVPRPFAQARAFVHSLCLKSREEWRQYCISEDKPDDIPSSPERVYENEWKGLGDWLGTGTVAPQLREYMPFDEAKSAVHSLHFKSQEEWFEYCKSGKKPKNIPTNPSVVYEEDWNGWPDWLGYEERVWSIKKVKELLRDLIESKIIYQWDEAVLYSFLDRKGVLNIKNRHRQFFRNLIEASRTDEGRKAIEEYAKSESEIPPDLSKGKVIGEELEEEIESASTQELSSLIENTDPLDYGEIKTAEQILSQTNMLESINVDEEAMQFYVDYSIDELWKSAFTNEENAVAAVRCEGKNGNKYHDTVVETFLSDYEGIQNIKIPRGFAFPYRPTLMQLYVAYKVKTNQYFGNFSGTGAGKTLSAVLSSRVIDSKITMIVCPNDVVNQWARSILEIFPDSQVITGKEAFYQKYNENKHQYLVLNYDKFSQEDSPNLILDLAKQKVDFVVLDEIHFVKKRDEESSQRRKNLDGLMTAVRKRNSDAKVLGLSATPVVNNLMEGSFTGINNG